MSPKPVERLKDWFKGYDKEAPAWLRSCRLVFAVSTLAFIVLFFGPAISSGDLLGFWMYQGALTYAGFPYMVIIVVIFMLAVISGTPIFLYERRRMKELEESKGKLSEESAEE